MVRVRLIIAFLLATVSPRLAVLRECTPLPFLFFVRLNPSG